MSEQHTTRRPGILPMLPLSEITKQTVKRECAGPVELDDQGYDFERCEGNDNGHLFHKGFCVHCFCEER